MWSNKGSSPATMAGDLGSNPDTAIKKINEKEWNSGMTPEEAIKILEKKKEYSERIIDNFLSHSRGEIKDANETIEMCDMAISALKEIQQYREMDRKLREAYGDCDGLLETVVEGFCRHSGVDIGNPIKSRLLTDEDVGKWDAYKEIGTVEECWEAVEKQKAERIEYETNAVFSNGFSHYRIGKCPICDNRYNSNDEIAYCSKCGQKLDWSEEDERD